MMLCPECKSDSLVYDTRTGPDNQIRRRRKCLNSACAMRWTTYETLQQPIASNRSQLDRATLIAARNLLNKLLLETQAPE